MKNVIKSVIKLGCNGLGTGLCASEIKQWLTAIFVFFLYKKNNAPKFVVKS